MPMRRTVPPDRHYGEAMYARGKTVRACRKPRAGMPDGWLARSGGRLAGMPRGAGLRPTAATCRNGYRTTHLECPRSDDRPVDTGAGGSVRFAGIEHRSHSVSRTGKLTEFRYHRIVAAPSHAVCAGAAKPDHPQLCVASDLAPRDLLWRQRESPLRAAICRGSAGWLVLRTLRLPQGLEPLLASEQPGDRCRRAERTASGGSRAHCGRDA